MSKVVKFAALQLTKSWDLEENLAKAKKAIRKAAQNGANVILPQELFAAPYFCKKQEAKYFELAEETANSHLIQEMSALAKELGVVIPVSYFEKAGNTFFNSLVMIDADGTVLDNYRKSHIPDGPGYSEKYYFSPGDTGFKVWQTKFGKFGAGICWDQWFPELARSLALHGAEAIFYPTAIGSEPQDPTLDSRDHWQRTMQGHSAANLVPVIASNRVGTEVDDGSRPRSTALLLSLTTLVRKLPKHHVKVKPSFTQKSTSLRQRKRVTRGACSVTVVQTFTPALVN